MSDMSEEQKQALESFKTIFAGSSSKVTASEVMQGLTQSYKLEMISSLPVPEKVVKADVVIFALEKIGYKAESELVKKLRDSYLMCNVSRSGKENRAKKIFEAFASVFRAELELEKSKKGMFSK